MSKFFLSFIILIPWLHASPTSEIVFESPVSLESFMGQELQQAMKHAFMNLDMPFKVVYLPSRRGIEELRQGRVDGTVARIGNLSEILKTKDLIRIDFPILKLHVSLWCRKNLVGSKPKIIVGSRLGSLVAMMVSPHLSSNVEVSNIRDQPSSIKMIQLNRLDCLMSNDQVLATDGITDKDLKDFDRFNLMTVRAFPWIAKRHEALKKRLEEGLQSYEFSKEFQEAFHNVTPICENSFEVICPDGIIFKKKVEFAVP